ncbi:MAG: ABC transporter permease, partial [Variovorax sp.]
MPQTSSLRALRVAPPTSLRGATPAARQSRFRGVSRFLSGFVPWLVPVTLIVAWQIASSLGWLSTRVLPAPVDVVKAAWSLTVSGELWTHVKVSAGRALAGLAIGGGLGLALGLLTGS